ncbi:hypothetical protein K1T71_003252 [Dendrolimus kikuchii]|uniref:Uncharacterized protein n=1 Tax=Dendrolimus kikuchii TaxID=765133 RepID=A0ACC1DC42_9NEOP|nr:hypothetical protein K1T71_003252 [Dendrolimus kikuchii]
MTATAPELSKSDFFDFVTSNEVTDAQYKQQMRSVNVFMESPDSRSNPLLSEEPKEQNNNNLLSVTAAPSNANTGMATATTSTALQSFDSIWNVDRERDRLDTAMLDLNKYTYWNQDSEINSAHSCADTTISNKLINNTDGQIYTLTVLNHDITGTSPNRYWGKEEDVSISSPTDIEQPSLDLETILNMNGFPNDFNQDLPKVEGFNYENGDSESQSSDLTTAVVKVEPYSYDDNEFQTSDKKEDPHSPSIISSPALLESQIEFNNNNNDWKITDQNTESNESLLRSALQGRAVLRYSALHKNTITKIDGNTELKRVIINNNSKDVPSMYQDGKDADPELLMAISPQNGNVNISILLEDPNTAIITNGENPTSTQQSVDDILLSHLDATYPDDYEKLKRIATELGESMQPYCTVEPIDPTRSVYNIHHLNGDVVTMIPTGEVQLPQHLQIVTASPTVTSTKSNIKKRRPPAKTPPVPPRTNIQAATSTSNGVRKERSLHYCSICSKGFKDKYSVNVHVRTHTGEKPFACSLCGKSFRQKAHLAKHYQTHVAQKTAAANGAVKPTKQR